MLQAEIEQVGCERVIRRIVRQLPHIPRGAERLYACARTPAQLAHQLRRDHGAQ